MGQRGEGLHTCLETALNRSRIHKYSRSPIPCSQPREQPWHEVVCSLRSKDVRSRGTARRTPTLRSTLGRASIARGKWHCRSPVISVCLAMFNANETYVILDGATSVSDRCDRRCHMERISSVRAPDGKQRAQVRARPRIVGVQCRIITRTAA